ncbi:MAG TPA: hypothetical protein PKC24_15000, partial [Cyclobacteriaceae bacterium]|nr:hypothetical protein [Cyclobacteriaceae bacterium]
WTAGMTGTPRADELLAVPDEPGRFEGEIWFMGAGTSSVALSVEDTEESAEVIIPVMAMATAQNKMEPELGIALAVLGIFLVVLMVTIVVSAMSDGLLPAGQAAGSNWRRRKITGVVIGSLVMILVLYLGKSWWDSWAAGYNQRLYQPFEAEAEFVQNENGQFIQLHIDNDKINFRRYLRKISYIIPDHGKLMHMFLIREGTLDAFAHLHPKRIDTVTFESKLPPLPAGKYYVFADITRYSGFSETIVSSLEIPETSTPVVFAKWGSGVDRDDTYTISNPINSDKPLLLDDDLIICGKPGMKTTLPNGYTAVWETDGEPFKARKLYALNFALTTPDGEPAKLEPYLGMMGHAVVMRNDGSVYIHLHPVGNYSMASQQVLIDRFNSGKIGWNNMPEGRSFADSIDHVIAWLDALPESTRDSLLMGNMVHTPVEIDSEEHDEHSMVRFPYAFPKAGDYRIWLQVKIEGKIVNGAFDVKVSE